MAIEPGAGDSSLTDPSETSSPIAEATEAAAQLSTDEQPLGPLGRRLNRRAPFLIGLTAAAGVAVTYGIVELIINLESILVLIGLALFIAVGLEPAVAWLIRRHLPRWLAVLIVFFAVLALVGGFLATAIPVVVAQSTELAERIPAYLHELQNHNSLIGKLNDRFHIQQRITTLLNSQGSGLATGLLGAGKAVFSALTDFFVVVVLTIYFVFDLPRIRAAGYRLVPASRRPRAILLGDEISGKVGAYVLGNVLISLIAGVLTFGWLLIFQVPYALLLALTVAVLDLIPVVGSVAGGVVVCLVALTVSWPVCLATIGFYVVYRFAEDYLLVPKIIGGVVKVPALVTVVAVLLGGALLGIIGALVAIPIAAAVLLLAREVVFPRLDRT
ncbi:MAG TPA: AI-2E family transporter [Pseudonocardiaceae bacterium]|nr:AI-2E family transporter [Pseudonocardiaceae bacterium]